ncbi:helix-turn-helix domain-containing protein [Isoptericola rhizosphaerae]|uniref:helix-turn-helix domain-containing protein n=1 Tax=Isoptericola rhizosphaerae TaxID=3377837 RepID=UPI003839F2A5
MRGRRQGAWTVEYPVRGERPLTKLLPRGGPAAVLVYGLDGTCGALCLDLDVVGDDVDATAAEAAALEAWLVECGARVVTDVSPTGGRHIYVPLAERLAFDVARELVEAMALLFPSLDPGPHRSVRSGCIRTPGALHKGWGHQELTMSLSRAYDVLRRPNAADVVEAIRVRLRPQIAAWRSRTAALTAVDDSTSEPGAAAGPAKGLRDPILRIARHGTYDTARYPSPSEARAAVMAAAARAGWHLRDVVARLEDGRWAGLRALYAHHSPSSQRRRITTDWAAAQRLVATTECTNPQARPSGEPGNDTVRISNTSATKSQGGYPPPGLDRSDAGDEHQFIRTWRAALRTTELHRFPGRSGYAIRFVLRSLGGFAHATGSRYVAVGTRSLAVAAGLDHSTVSLALKAATAAGWCDLLKPAHGETADLYALTIPEELTGHVEHLRWDAGKLHGLRPAFRELGHVAALVFEAIETGRAHTVLEAAQTTAISRSTVHEAVQALLAWGLVTRDDAGDLAAHPDRLLAAAEQLGALDVVAAQIRTYARHRTAWRAYLHRHDPEAQPGDINHFPDPDDLAWLETAGWWLPPDAAVGPHWTVADVVARSA